MIFVLPNTSFFSFGLFINAHIEHRDRNRACAQVFGREGRAAPLYNPFNCAVS